MTSVSVSKNTKGSSFGIASKRLDLVAIGVFLAEMPRCEGQDLGPIRVSQKRTHGVVADPRIVLPFFARLRFRDEKPPRKIRVGMP